MTWFRKKQKEIAEDLVEDASKVIKKKTSHSVKSYLPVIFAAAVAVDYMMNSGQVTSTLNPSKFTLYIENVNVTFH